MSQPVTEDLSPADLADFKAQMVALIPTLRGFARGLCRDRVLADDLVQEAMMRAWASRHTFVPGSNFKAWMFIILRNHYYSGSKKRARDTVWDPEAAERVLVQDATQEAGIHVDDVMRAMQQLPEQQREILLLVAGAGLSYEGRSRCRLQYRYRQKQTQSRPRGHQRIDRGNECQRRCVIGSVRLREDRLATGQKISPEH
jgi:RNA polymerase sigma-70 factor, ECF subfamily